MSSYKLRELTEVVDDLLNILKFVNINVEAAASVNLGDEAAVCEGDLVSHGILASGL